MKALWSYEDFEAFLGRFTNYERMLFVHYDKKTFGIDRMRSFAAELGNPQEASPAVHIAGTKGKGSTCLILESLLLAEGYRVGTYLSPHVERLAERIRVDGREVEGRELIEATNGMLPALARRQHQGPDSFPSFFELMTALSMEIFRRRRVDWAIYEVGLGGRLDATNVLRPRLCAITNIGLEHTQQLGGTLAEIAREKGGIIKPGIPVALGPLLPEPQTEILRIANERGAPVLPWRPGHVSPVDAEHLRLAEPQAVLGAGPVAGPALRDNLALALQLAREILSPEGREISPEAIRRALARLKLPARIERFGGDPPVVIDGAHTPEAVRALGEALQEFGFPRPRVLIVSIARGKEIPGILAELRHVGEEILWTRADPIRSASPEELRAAFGSGTEIDSPEEAWIAALARNHAVVVTGSFYLAGLLRPLARESRGRDRASSTA